MKKSVFQSGLFTLLVVFFSACSGTGSIIVANDSGSASANEVLQEDAADVDPGEIESIRNYIQKKKDIPIDARKGVNMIALSLLDKYDVKLHKVDVSQSTFVEFKFEI